MGDDVMGLAIFFSLTTYETTYSQPSSKTFSIGVSAPLSGTAAVRGKYIKDGAEFAVKQINKTGGGKGLVLELKLEDNEGNPTKTASSVEKLLKKEEVKALLVADSTGTIASLPLIEKARVPMFTTAFSPSLTEKGTSLSSGHHLRRHYRRSGADLAVKELKYKKVESWPLMGTMGKGCHCGGKAIGETGLPGSDQRKVQGIGSGLQFPVA